MFDCPATIQISPTITFWMARVSVPQRIVRSYGPPSFIAGSTTLNTPPSVCAEAVFPFKVTVTVALSGALPVMTISIPRWITIPSEICGGIWRLVTAGGGGSTGFGGSTTGFSTTGLRSAGGGGGRVGLVVGMTMDRIAFFPSADRIVNLISAVRPLASFTYSFPRPSKGKVPSVYQPHTPVNGTSTTVTFPL